AAADGGSAACTVPFEIARTQSLGEISLTPGAYKVTVLDTSEMTCDEANDQLRAVLREPGNDLPEGWKLDAGTGTISRADGTDAFRFDPDMTVEGAAGTSLWDDMQSWMLTWLPIIFLGLIAVAIIWMI